MHMMDHCHKNKSKTSIQTIQQRNKKYSESSYQVKNPVSILQKARFNPRFLNHQEVRQLHGTIGNQAVQRLFTQSESSIQRINSPVRLSRLSTHSIISRKPSPSSKAALKAEKLTVLSKKGQKEIKPLLNPKKNVKKNRQKAIDKILKYSGLQARLPSSLDGGKMWYQPNLATLCKRKRTDPKRKKIVIVPED